MPSTIQLTSPAFAQGQPIPKKYVVAGENLSPPLAWSGAPDNTKEFALIVDDPDAPTSEPWVHWVIYKIPADVRELPEGVSTETEISAPLKARQGANSWGQNVTGYKGPQPPSGTHRYLQPGVGKRDLLAAMQGHILAKGELMGTFSAN